MERLSADAADRRRRRPAKAARGLALAAVIGFAGGPAVQAHMLILTLEETMAATLATLVDTRLTAK